jgi:hypothetical protein
MVGRSGVGDDVCAARRMGRTFAVAVAVLGFAGSVRVGAQTEAVLAETRHRIETLDYRTSGRLIKNDGRGARTTYKIAIKGHWFPDGLRLLCEMTDPVGARTRVWLHMGVNGRMGIEAAGPGSERAVAVPFERWSEGLLGTDISYEDLAEDQFFWKSQAMLPAEKCGVRECVVVKSSPGEREQSVYASVTSAIDRSIAFPMHVVKTARGTGQQKEFTYFGMRESGGVQTATRMEVKMVGGTGSTLLVLERGVPKAKLTRRDFDLAVEK